MSNEEYIDPAEMEHPEDDDPGPSQLSIDLYNRKYGPGIINKNYHNKKECETMYIPPPPQPQQHYGYGYGNSLAFPAPPPPYSGGGFNSYYYNRNNYNPYYRGFNYNYYNQEYYDNKFNRELRQNNYGYYNYTEPDHYIGEDGLLYLKMPNTHSYNVASYTKMRGTRYIQSGNYYMNDPAIIPTPQQLERFETMYCVNGYVPENFVPHNAEEHMIYDFKRKMSLSRINTSLLKSAIHATGDNEANYDFDYYGCPVIDQYDPSRYYAPPTNNLANRYDGMTDEEIEHERELDRLAEKTSEFIRSSQINYDAIQNAMNARHAMVSREYRKQFGDNDNISAYEFFNNYGGELYAKAHFADYLEAQRDGRQLYDRDRFRQSLLNSPGMPNLNPRELASLGYDVKIGEGVILRHDGTTEVRAPERFRDNKEFSDALSAYKASYANKLKGGDPT